MFLTLPALVAERADLGRVTHPPQVPPTLHQRTWYPVTAPEPTEDGAAHVAFADLATGNLTARFRACVGAPAITADDLGEVLDLLLWFVVLTVNVYAFPFVSPSTVHVSGLAGVVRIHEHDLNTEPTFGVAVTLYSLIGAPPVDDGATHDTTTDLLRGEPDTDRATDGAVAVTVRFAVAGCTNEYPSAFPPTQEIVNAEPAAAPTV